MSPPSQTILVAEDNPVERKLLAIRLRQMGYRVVAANDGVEALERTRGNRPDLIVSDVLMPRLDGFKLCQTLRRDPELSEIPVVLTSSATIEEDDRLLALELGASAFVLRTPDCQRIIEAVRASLEEGAPPPPAEDQQFVSEMRQRFLAEAGAQARMLLETLETGFDAAGAKALAHRWAGVGGTLGFAQISQRAYQLEGLCERPFGEVAGALRLRLTGMLNLLSDAARAHDVTPETPVEVFEVLAGKRVALAGFGDADATVLCRALERAGAQASRLTLVEAPPDSPAIAPADAVILFLESNGRPTPWTDPQVLTSNGKPLLLVGARDALLRAGAVTRKYADDFVLDPWSPEEVLLRVSRMLRRSQRTGERARYRDRGGQGRQSRPAGPGGRRRGRG